MIRKLLLAIYDVLVGEFTAPDSPRRRRMVARRLDQHFPRKTAK